MCGIAGILPDRPSDPAELERLVRRMNDTLVNRGPDDEGYFVRPDIALAMRRLAIIDVAHGQQPMQSADGRLTLVFNGEIYNFRTVRAQLEHNGATFNTNSDTEVVLRSLESAGLAGIAPLEGMFGFAAWDASRKELTLARDWIGQKSLFFTRTPLGLAFASEIKALLTLPGVPRRLNLEALSHYMSLRYLPHRSTLFEGIEKLPPAHALIAGPSGVRFEMLWRPAYEPKLDLSESEFLDELDRTMGQVIGEHLISEVPLGCFLSGGIDSSLIVAYAAKASSQPVRTFCIGVHEEAQNEAPWARLVAERYRTDHYEEIVEPDLAQLAPRMVAALEEPTDPFGAGVYVASSIARKHVTVTLGGDGGDELFSGYDRYLGQQFAELYAHLPRPLRHRVLRPILRSIPDNFQYNTFAQRLRWLDRVSDFRGPQRYAESAAFLRFAHAQKQALFSDESWRQVGSAISERLLEAFFEDGCARTFIDGMLHADVMTRLADNDLPTTDRLTMAHSLELRSPFLDRRVATLAMRAPSQWKMKKRTLKYLTRRLAERHLPRSLIYRPKKGFGFPLALWLRGPLQGLMRQTLQESRLIAAGVFQPDYWRQMIDEHTSGAMDHNYRLWMLFNLELFWRHFFDGEDVKTLEGWVAEARDGSTAASSAAA